MSESLRDLVVPLWRTSTVLSIPQNEKFKGDALLQKKYLRAARRWAPATAVPSIFAGRIYCGDCGGLYGVKVWGANTKYRRTVWRCNRKYDNETRCSTPHVARMAGILYLNIGKRSSAEWR